MKKTIPKGIQIESRLQGRMGAGAVAAQTSAVRILTRAAACLRLGPRHELSLLICDSPTMRRINRRWRGKDLPTNVLSFPSWELRPGARPPEGPLGDIVLALPVARREARELDRLFDSYLALLLVHGLLHLLGYDHMNDSEAEVMESKERRILKRLENIHD